MRVAGPLMWRATAAATLSLRRQNAGVEAAASGGASRGCP